MYMYYHYSVTQGNLSHFSAISVNTNYSRWSYAACFDKLFIVALSHSFFQKIAFLLNEEEELRKLLSRQGTQPHMQHKYYCITLLQALIKLIIDHLMIQKNIIIEVSLLYVYSLLSLVHLHLDLTRLKHYYDFISPLFV